MIRCKMTLDGLVKVGGGSDVQFNIVTGGVKKMKNIFSGPRQEL